MPETHPFISVVVPVYNVASYLRRCVDSLLAQTFRDFEIILVDDGSTDGSGEICDEYKNETLRYENHIPNGKENEDETPSLPSSLVVRVIHQQNVGVSSARNRGVVEARGVYISFVDADDWVEPDFLEAFVENININQNPQPSFVDLVVQGYVNHEGEVMSWPKAYYATAQEVCSPLIEMEGKRLIGYVWNKLFRRQVIVEHGIRFDPSVPIGEDFLFSMTFISHCQSMAVTPYVGYHYFYPPGDHKDYPFAAWSRRLDGFAELLPTMMQMPPSVARQFMAREFKMGLYVMRIAYHERLPRRERLAFLRKIKSWGKGNDEVRLSGYEPSFRTLGFLVLYLPCTLCDLILMIVRNVRKH